MTPATSISGCVSQRLDSVVQNAQSTLQVTEDSQDCQEQEKLKAIYGPENPVVHAALLATAELRRAEYIGSRPGSLNLHRTNAWAALPQLEPARQVRCSLYHVPGNRSSETPHIQGTVV